MNHKIRLGLAALCGGLLAGAANPAGTVNAERLNIRIQPELKSAVAVKLAKGAAVEITGRKGEFLEIKAPKETPVFISAVYIGKDGKLTRELQMRSAESGNAPSYGVLPQGTQVEVIHISKYGWAQIVPPAALRLYAARFYIDAAELPPAEAVKPAAEVKPQAALPAEKETAAPAAEKATEVKPVEVKQTPAPKQAAKTAAAAEETPTPVEVVPLEMNRQELELKQLGIDLSAGVPATGDGFLVELQSQTTPSVQYALTGDNNAPQVLFFISTDKAAAVRKFVDKEVKISGIAYQVPNWKNRVLRLEKIELKK